MPGREHNVGVLAPAEFEERLRQEGLGVRFGPFDLHLWTSVRPVARALHTLYAHYPVLDDDRVYSAHVDLQPVRALRWRSGAKVRLTIDGRAPHEDMPAAHALAVLEWGLNLVIALRHYRYLMLHAAVVERNGQAMLLPAWPGHGKTTLCVALVHRGWRLLSDEFGLLRPGIARMIPVPRLMPLKNESIEVIRAFAPEAVIGPSIPNTRKGTVAHVRPPAVSIGRAADEAPVRWLVFPKWTAGAPLVLEPVSPMEAFMQLATNAFNYEMLGVAAFQTVRSIVEMSSCHRLEYSDLDEAVAALTELADGDRH